MDEVWKDIEGYEGYYQVSNCGRVKSLDRIVTSGKTKKGMIIQGILDIGGYVRVTLWKSCKPKKYMVHRLVAFAFLDNPNNLKMINHIDENKENNNVTNLEWCDCKYNINYGTRTIRASGENTKNSKLKKEDVIRIRSVYKPKSKQFGAIALAKEYGVTPTTIDKIVHYRGWNYI